VACLVLVETKPTSEYNLPMPCGDGRLTLRRGRSEKQGGLVSLMQARGEWAGGGEPQVPEYPVGKALCSGVKSILEERMDILVSRWDRRLLYQIK
jgi:hypothetical protein